MRGHLPLLRMRRAGAMPHAAWLVLDPVPAYLLANWPAESWHGHVAAHIAVDPDESIARLDLRMLIGLPLVHVDGSDRERVMALFAACVEAKPRRVIAAVLAPGRFGPQTVEIADSEGVLTWQA